VPATVLFGGVDAAAAGRASPNRRHAGKSVTARQFPQEHTPPAAHTGCAATSPKPDESAAIGEIRMNFLFANSNINCYNFYGGAAP
jgi:hypothetical protein